METFENFFLDRFPVDEISISCIDGDRHISIDSPISTLARTLLTVINKTVKRLSYYELLQTRMMTRITLYFSAAYDTGCLHAES